MSLEKFLATIPDPDHKGPKEQQGTIQQFTPQGLEAATSYYNQKYSQRGQIHQAIVVIKQNEREAVGAGRQTQVGLVEKMVEGVLENLFTLKSKAQQEGSQKLLLTIAEENDSKIRIAHSIPFALTDGKLILLRDEDSQFGQQIFSQVAEKLGVELVQSREPIYDKTNPARTSIQGDHSSCHFIALGVLKDLTVEDLQKVSDFENGFTPLPKSLKYSQSATHIQKSLPEEELTTAVKKDGRSASEYAAQNKREEKIGEEKVTITRITEKFNRFKSDLEKIVGAAEGDLSAPELAAQILQKRLSQTKEVKAPATEVALTKKYQPIIAQDCFEKFFDETKELGKEELKLKKDLKVWLGKALSYQITNPEALTLATSLDEIKTREDLGRVFAHVDLDHLRLIDSKHLSGKNNITPNLRLEFAGPELASSTKGNLQSYVEDTGFSGSIALSQRGATHIAHSQNIGSNTTFPIHSVGKLFTGILVMEAVRQGILEEGQLTQTVKLADSALEKLPENIREHLEQITLHQLMTHQSGLQDYLPNYQKAVASALQLGEEIPRVTRAEDILPFAESTILTLPYVNEKGKRVESDYSNLGIGLVSAGKIRNFKD